MGPPLNIDGKTYEDYQSIANIFNTYFTNITDKMPVNNSVTMNLALHHHHISVMELGHLLTRSGLTYPEVSSKVCHDSFCQLGNSVSLPWVIYYEAFYLHVISSFSCIPVICLKLALFLIPLQFVHLFCNIFIKYLLDRFHI